MKCCEITASFPDFCYPLLTLFLTFLWSKIRSAMSHLYIFWRNIFFHFITCLPQNNIGITRTMHVLYTMRLYLLSCCTYINLRVQFIYFKRIKRKWLLFLRVLNLLHGFQTWHHRWLGGKKWSRNYHRMSPSWETIILKSADIS